MIFASFYKRIIAFLIDVMIIYLSIKVTFLSLHKSLDLSTWMLLSGVLSIFYFVFFWIKLNGQTPGAYLTRIRVVAKDNRQISFKKAFLRASSLFVFVCPFGVLVLILLSELIGTFVLLRKKLYLDTKQTTWDIATSTYVIKASQQ